MCRGDYVKILREQRGWTQEQFAAIAGYSPRLIRKAEGSASLSPETIADIAEALGTETQPVYPEDLVSDPISAARLFVQSYDLYEREMLTHCGHVLAEQFVFWCAGQETGIPFAGTYYGLAGFQSFLDCFFTLIRRSSQYRLTPTFSLAGNEVVARYVENANADGSAGGPPLWIVNIMQFERGKITRIDNYFDTQTGQQALDNGMPAA